MPVFRIVYRPVFDINQLEPHTHIVREMIVLEENATLIIKEDATVWVTAGDSGAYMKVDDDSTTEFA